MKHVNFGKTRFFVSAPFKKPCVSSVFKGCLLKIPEYERNGNLCFPELNLKGDALKFGRSGNSLCFAFRIRVIGKGPAFQETIKGGELAFFGMYGKNTAFRFWNFRAVRSFSFPEKTEMSLSEKTSILVNGIPEKRWCLGIQYSRN